ncbi:hypothetical protein BC831DRAFT_549156 [Entophlyctis helioformis]|nr:hypothetical protein BC831DRAFT_549156 [Entophlyctis helioformis]
MPPRPPRPPTPRLQPCECARPSPARLRLQLRSLATTASRTTTRSSSSTTTTTTTTTRHEHSKAATSTTTTTATTATAAPPARLPPRIGDAWPVFAQTPAAERARWPPAAFDRLLFLLAKHGRSPADRLARARAVLAEMRHLRLPTRTPAALRSLAILLAYNRAYDRAVAAFDELLQVRLLLPADRDGRDDRDDLPHLMALGIVPHRSCAAESLPPDRAYPEAKRWMAHLRSLNVAPHHLPWRLFFHMALAACTSNQLDTAEKWIANIDRRFPAMSTTAVPSLYTWLIQHCCMVGAVEGSMLWFGKLAMSGKMPPLQAFRALIEMWVSRGDINEALNVEASMNALRVEKDRHVYAVLIRGLCAANRVDAASQMLGKMKRAGFDRDARIYTQVMAACLRDRQWEATVRWFVRMRADGVHADNVALVCALKAHYMLFTAHAEFHSLAAMFDADAEGGRDSRAGDSEEAGGGSSNGDGVLETAGSRSRTWQTYQSLVQAHRLALEVLDAIDSSDFDAAERLYTSVSNLGLQLPSIVQDSLFRAVLSAASGSDLSPASPAESKTLPVVSLSDAQHRSRHAGHPYLTRADPRHLRFAIRIFKDVSAHPQSGLLQPLIDTLLSLCLSLGDVLHAREIYDLATRSYGVWPSQPVVTAYMTTLARHPEHADVLDALYTDLAEFGYRPSVLAVQDLVWEFVRRGDGETAARWCTRLSRLGGRVHSDTVTWIAAVQVAAGVPRASVCAWIDGIAGTVDGGSEATALVYAKSSMVALGAQQAILGSNAEGVVHSGQDYAALVLFCRDQGVPSEGIVWARQAFRALGVSVQLAADGTVLNRREAPGQERKSPPIELLRAYAACLYDLDIDPSCIVDAFPTTDKTVLDYVHAHTLCRRIRKVNPSMPGWLSAVHAHYTALRQTGHAPTPWTLAQIVRLCAEHIGILSPSASRHPLSVTDTASARVVANRHGTLARQQYKAMRRSSGYIGLAVAAVQAYTDAHGGRIPAIEVCNLLIDLLVKRRYTFAAHRAAAAFDDQVWPVLPLDPSVPSSSLVLGINRLRSQSSVASTASSVSHRGAPVGMFVRRPRVSERNLNNLIRVNVDTQPIGVWYSRLHAYTMTADASARPLFIWRETAKRVASAFDAACIPSKAALWARRASGGGGAKD